MTKPKLILPRRLFLRGAAGVTLGLPILETFQPRGARAQAATTPPFLMMVIHANGVVQAGRAIDGSTDPERFWPTQTGALTTAALEADKASRATGELAAHAAKLTMVRGLAHAFQATGCMHASGDAQLLTSAKIGGEGNKVLGLGESIDTLIARELNAAGREPLVLHAGKYSPGGTGYDIPGYVSYVGPSQPRTYLDAPLQAYERMLQVVGPGGAPSSDGPTAEERLAVLRSKSVNDVLRAQIQELLARRDLSQSDRARLEQHFSAIRDLELRMVGVGPTVPAISDASVADMRAIDPKPYDMAYHEKLIELHMQLMVFGIASGFTRVALLKVGDREDDHQFTIDGKKFVYHTASHRGLVNGASLCSQVDYIHLRHFERLLDQLAAIQPGTGTTLLDAGLTVWTNQVANGSHSFVNVPWILAGSAGGLLRTGQFMDVSDRQYKTNRMLNTLINAAGVRKSDNSLVDDFGDPSLTKGVVDEIMI
jgi:hypothetical protein